MASHLTALQSITVKRRFRLYTHARKPPALGGVPQGEGSAAVKPYLRPTIRPHWMQHSGSSVTEAWSHGA